MADISSIQYREGELTRLVTSCVGTAFCNTLLREIKKGQGGEKDDVSSYWTILRNGEDN